MTAAESASTGPVSAGSVDAEATVLPELRAVWWESGLRARVDAGIMTLLAELPRLVGAAFVVSWRASRTRTAIVAAATVLAGVMSTFGLLATQQVLVGLFTAGPTPSRVTAALPALLTLAAVTAVRAGARLRDRVRRERPDTAGRSTGPAASVRNDDDGAAGVVRPGRVRRRDGTRVAGLRVHHRAA
jgi:hypothetical protein